MTTKPMAMKTVWSILPPPPRWPTTALWPLILAAHRLPSTAAGRATHRKFPYFIDYINWFYSRLGVESRIRLTHESHAACKPRSGRLCCVRSFQDSRDNWTVQNSCRTVRVMALRTKFQTVPNQFDRLLEQAVIGTSDCRGTTQKKKYIFFFFCIHRIMNTVTNNDFVVVFNVSEFFFFAF